VRLVQTQGDNVENQNQKIANLKDRFVAWLLRVLLEQFRVTIERIS
jgi:hypothetical protein